MFAPERLRVQVSAVSMKAYEQLNYVKDKLKAACTPSIFFSLILSYLYVLIQSFNPLTHLAAQTEKKL